ncbi:acetyl esterase [Asanoa ferruginea]|uniref:Acetyl esterase n=1 Tax=Asanoa ferruginea TaxID=53367 RepID=A0A3D9ZLN4_9ACTN|nr:alpha/beta hydrolase [Asanoa ferruginea]REF98298.1 acetyl esterase [Asanoa ferruginea]GIF52034.1 putative lipase/esterase [Asanoa ferruginea]
MLTPEARAIVDAIRSAAPPPEQIGPAAARKASDDRRAAQVRELEPIAKVEDLLVGDVPVRIYRPATGTVLSGTVFAHGGGWVLCDLDSHDPLCRSIANRARTVVVSVDYRRAPEARFPAAIDDVYAVLCWVAEHAADLGIDPARLAVAGDSAGGNLAAAAAIRARDTGGPALAAQLLLYPVLDGRMDTDSYRRFGHGFGLEATSMAWYWDQYVPDQADRSDPLAAPARADRLDGLPPAIIAAAECDPLCDEATAYAERLGNAWVRTYPSGFHGFLSLPPGLLPVADEALAEVTSRLGQALAPPSTDSTAPLT